MLPKWGSENQGDGLHPPPASKNARDGHNDSPPLGDQNATRPGVSRPVGPPNANMSQANCVPQVGVPHPTEPCLADSPAPAAGDLLKLAGDPLFNVSLSQLTPESARAPGMKTRLTNLLSPNVNSFVTACLLVAVAPGPELEAAGPLFVRGDVNADDAVDLADATFGLGALFLNTPQPPCLDAADTNDDGAFDVSDPIYLLIHLFGAGPPPPSPGPDSCGGEDPTSDALDCMQSLEPPPFPPRLELTATYAPAPGVRERTRVTLPRLGDTFQIGAGESWSLLVQAAANELSRAPVELAAAGDASVGNSTTLHVVCDRDLGDPSAGGVAAGENLALHFLSDLDLWEDPIYLDAHAALRIAGDGPLAPASGTYVFTATVTDTTCAVSAAVTLTVDVASTTAPDLFAWIEPAGELQRAPRAHNEGTGNARVASGESFLLVVEACPNGRQPEATPPIDELVVTADVPIGTSSDLSDLFTDVEQNTFVASFTSEADLPALGNTVLTISVGGAERLFPLEVKVPYAASIQSVWNENCSGCHEGSNAFKGLELVDPAKSPQEVWRNYVNIFAAEPGITSIAPILVRPFFPERSYMIHKLDGTQGLPEVDGEGGRMPLDGPPYLDDDIMHLIRSWVLQGADAEE